jgi:penicillin-binding protein 1B
MTNLMRRTPILVALGVAGFLSILAITVAVYSTVELRRFAKTDVRRATFVYAAGQPLARGVHVGRIDLAGALARLGYAEVRRFPNAPGQFRRAAGAWDIYARTADRPIHLDVADERIARVTREGKDVDDASLEGIVLAGGGDQANEAYRPIRLGHAPPALVQAVLAAEDHRFYDHGAVDLRGLARAAWANLAAGRVRQGGSTLTQQLVKSRLLSRERTFSRKVREAWLSALVEWRYSKQQILEAYLNEIYLGQRGILGIHGVGAAARVYFGKEVHQLTLGESALLAGMVRAPNTYSPLLNPERARARRDAVLARMRELGMIDARQYDSARREPVQSAARPWPAVPAPYFVDYARQEVEERFGAGTRVVTTVDPVLQRFAENAVAHGLDDLETRVPRLRSTDPRARLQAVLIAIDPATGEIRAFVGGRDYQSSQFDRAAFARRQPGSAFKPFVYLTALRPHGGTAAFTAASMVDDAPITVKTPDGGWSPRNYENHYEGRVTVRRALEQSLNAATVRIAQAVGPAAVIETARALGLEEHPAAVPAVALGAFEVTPIDLARAYAPLANGGVRPGVIHAVRAVYQADGTSIVPADEPAPARVLSPAEAYLMTSLLAGVMRSGTAAGARIDSGFGELAGKTGTTNEGRDAWFVGYSPRLLAVVWVGYDDARSHGLTGAQAALPIWGDFMRQTLATYPAGRFAVPPGITFANIDATNGLVANDACPLVVSETFLTGTVPGPCLEHRTVAARVLDVWQRIRRWFTR